MASRAYCSWQVKEQRVLSHHTNFKIMATMTVHHLEGMARHSASTRVHRGHHASAAPSSIAHMRATCKEPLSSRLSHICASSSSGEASSRGSMPQRLWHVIHEPQMHMASAGTEPAPQELGVHDSLTLDLKRLQAYRAYEQELSKPASKVCLLTCAALIAKASKYPLLEVQEVLDTVDQLAQEVKKQLPKDAPYPMKTLQTIIQVLYSQKGFRGNTIDYYDDDNSYINKVLINRTGIPISLSLVFMEVAARVGIPMKGVNLPAHFMLGVEGLGVLIDAYAGEVVLVEDAAAKLSALMQTPVRLNDEHVLNSKPVPPRKFLLRMLNNLKQIYIMTDRTDMALRIIRLMRVTQPSSSELRDEGLCLYSMGRYQEAAELLSEYLRVDARAEDLGMVETVLEGCRELLREQAAALAEERLRQEQEEGKQQHDGEGRHQQEEEGPQQQELAGPVVLQAEQKVQGMAVQAPEEVDETGPVALQAEQQGVTDGRQGVAQPQAQDVALQPQRLPQGTVQSSEVQVPAAVADTEQQAPATEAQPGVNNAAISPAHQQAETRSSDDPHL